MKTIYIYILSLILGLLLFNSCEDLLDIPQQGVISIDNFYQTDQEAIEAITAVYSTWRDMAYNEFFLKNMLSDDIICGGGSRGDNNQMEQLNEYTYSAANTVVSGLFSSLYQLIYLSNLVIDHFEEDSDVKAQAIAEAKTARAWAYFELVTLWGPVPFSIHELSPSEYQQNNGDVNEIWAQIEKDLSEAANSNALPEKSSASDTSVGAHVTKHTALSFLGKAQLYQGKYEEAATTLKSVINSGKYELYTDYENVLREVADFCSESIFEVNSLNDPENAFTQGTLFLAPMIGWRTDHLTIDGFYTGDHNIYPSGWGFASPTQNLFDAFVLYDGVDSYRFKNSIRTYSDIGELGIQLNPGSNLYGNVGYFGWKHRYIGEETVENSFGLQASFNFRVMRYAEVLLMAAEACYQSDNKGDAVNYINQIRTRAKLEPLASVSIDDIKMEKRLELCCENVRYQDLLRWDEAETALANQGKDVPSFFGYNDDGTYKVNIVYTNETYGFKKGKHEYLPFPEHEINVNKNIIQNPGW